MFVRPIVSEELKRRYTRTYKINKQRNQKEKSLIYTIDEVNMLFDFGNSDVTSDFINFLVLCARFLVYQSEVICTIPDMNQYFLMLDSSKPVEYNIAKKQASTLLQEMGNLKVMNQVIREMTIKVYFKAFWAFSFVLIANEYYLKQKTKMKKCYYVLGILLTALSKL